MILLIEIILTISAWRKGWKARALLPLGLGMSVSFLIGMAVGASGGTIENVIPLCVLIELAILVSLIIMAIKAPRHYKEAQTPSTEELTAQTVA